MVYVIVLLMRFHSVMFMFSILRIVLLLFFHMGAYAHRRLIPLKINQALATGSCMIQGLAVLYNLLVFCGQGWFSLPYTEWSQCKKAGRSLLGGSLSGILLV